MILDYYLSFNSKVCYFDIKKDFLNSFVYIRITSNDQVWNRPYAKTAVNQAANLLNRNSRSSTYSLTPHQPTATTLQNNAPGEGDIPPTHNDPNFYYNRDPRIHPVSMNPNVPPNIPLKSESFAIPQPFHGMSPPSLSPTLPHRGSVENRAPIFNSNVSSYSTIPAQPSPIDPTESSPPSISETFMEVLPSEITCPACILQVKHKKLQRIQRSVFFYVKF